MKSKLVALFLTLFVNLFSFVAYAQEDPPADDDPIPAAPINSKLIWLVLIGIVFMAYYFKRNHKKVQNT